MSVDGYSILQAKYVFGQLSTVTLEYLPVYRSENIGGDWECLYLLSSKQS